MKSHLFLDNNVLTTMYENYQGNYRGNLQMQTIFEKYRTLRILKRILARTITRAKIGYLRRGVIQNPFNVVPNS